MEVRENSGEAPMLGQGKEKRAGSSDLKGYERPQSRDPCGGCLSVLVPSELRGVGPINLNSSLRRCGPVAEGVSRGMNREAFEPIVISTG